MPSTLLGSGETKQTTILTLLELTRDVSVFVSGLFPPEEKQLHESGAVSAMLTMLEYLCSDSESKIKMLTSPTQGQ